MGPIPHPRSGSEAWVPRAGVPWGPSRAACAPGWLARLWGLWMGSSGAGPARPGPRRLEAWAGLVKCQLAMGSVPTLPRPPQDSSWKHVLVKGSPGICMGKVACQSVFDPGLYKGSSLKHSVGRQAPDFHLQPIVPPLRGSPPRPPNFGPLHQRLLRHSRSPPTPGPQLPSRSHRPALSAPRGD